LDCSSIGSSFVRVDELGRFFVVEKVRDEFDDTGNEVGTADKEDVMDASLFNFEVTKNCLNRLESAAEEV